MKHDPREIMRTLALLVRPGDVAELRVPNTHQGTLSGYFDNPPDLLKAIAGLNGHAPPGIYLTLNPVTPSLLARAQNRIQARAKVTTSDYDVLERRWLLIDCDAQRPSGISATDEEHDAALELARAIRFELHEAAWPAPALGDSGNGGHLLYRIDLPNDKESAKLIEGVLKALAARFNTAAVKIDVSVHNASRISKCYGTVVRKGDDIPERPHRMARLIDVPAQLEPVPRELLEEIAATLADPAPPPRHSAPGRAFDIESFIARYLKARPPVPHDGGRKWPADCPFNPEHLAPDAAVFERADGSLGFKCLHASCSDRHWRDVRELFEGPRPDQTKSKSQPIYTYANVPSVWDYETVEVRYIIPDLLPEAAITLITGDSGHGKSIFASAMAGAIIAGGDFLGRQAARRKVIYLDRENGLALVKKHLLDLHIERTPDLIYWGNWCEFPPDGPASVSLLELARAETPVLIFDSLIAFHTGDEQDASETRRFLQYFRNLAAAGATVILLHHIGKSDTARQYRGSTDIKASVDIAWLLEKLGDPAGLLTDLRLIPFKNRISAHNTIPLSFRDGLFITEQRPESNREIFERIVRLNPNSTGSEIEKLGMAAGLPKNRIAQLLLDGVQQGWLQMKLGKRNAKHYSLAEPVLGEI